MRCAKSYFEPTIYKKNLNRFWPLWVMYTVVWLFLLPVCLLNVYTQNRNDMAQDLAQLVSEWPLTLLTEGPSIWIALIYSLMIAVAVWNYLYNSRSANLFHALPVRREGHFLTNYLSGISFFLLPNLIVFVIMLAAEAFCGVFAPQTMVQWLLYQTLMCLFFFSFATACAMLTGNVVMLAVFYTVFNFLAVGITWLLDYLSTFFLYGYQGGLFNSPVIRWLTPIYCIMYKFSKIYPMEESIDAYGELVYSRNTDALPFLDGASVLWIYAAVGVGLAVVALLLYRRRQLESAGDVVAVKPLRVVFLYGVAICAALAGGCLSRIFSQESIAFLLFCLILCCIIGHFAALMLLEKSFKVFRNGWKSCLVSLAVVLVLCVGLELDPLGVETALPDVNTIQASEINSFYTYPYDSVYRYYYYQENQTSIEQTLAVHAALLADIDAREAFNWNPYDADLAVNWDAMEAGLARDSSLWFYYSLQNDGNSENHNSFKRYYDRVWLEYDNLNDPDSLESKLTLLFNNRETLAERYRLNHITEGKLVAVALQDDHRYMKTAFYVQEGDVQFLPEVYWLDESSWDEISLKGIATEEVTEEVPIDIENSATFAYATQTQTTVDGHEIQGGLTEQQVSKEQMEQLRQAVLEDFYDNNLGVRYLFNQDPAYLENTCYVDLILYYSYTYESNGKMVTSIEDTTITMSAQAARTIAVLTDWNAFTTGGAELRTLNDHVIIP